MGLTRRQAEILAYITEYSEVQGYAPPSRRSASDSAFLQRPPCTNMSPFWWRRDT